ncbi:atherin-like [Poecile atricapillus]|uniref:atherin-like n=1 Tax=Poecile atricapillus TaxID=48891 RepID=UPI002739C6B5|nr:atherin-like [Poecile atricapillus]
MPARPAAHSAAAAASRAEAPSAAMGEGAGTGSGGRGAGGRPPPRPCPSAQAPCAAPPRCPWPRPAVPEPPPCGPRRSPRDAAVGRGHREPRWDPGREPAPAAPPRSGTAARPAPSLEAFQARGQGPRAGIPH